MKAALVVLALCVASAYAGFFYAGPNDEDDPVGEYSCCVRTFLRNTGGSNAARGHTDQVLAAVEQMIKPKKRSAEQERGKFITTITETLADPDFINSAFGSTDYEYAKRDMIASGRVTPLDTMCVNSKDSIFRDWYDVYRQVHAPFESGLAAVYTSFGGPNKRDVADERQAGGFASSTTGDVPKTDSIFCPVIQPPRDYTFNENDMYFDGGPDGTIKPDGGPDGTIKPDGGPDGKPDGFPDGTFADGTFDGGPDGTFAKTGRPYGPYTQGYGVWVKSLYECAIFQSCNNFQFDVSVCGNICGDLCGYQNEATDTRDSWFSDINFDGRNRRGDNSECYEECRFECEYGCVGRCFNDYDCVEECVLSSSGERSPDLQEGKGGDLLGVVGFSFAGSANLIQDFLYGDVQYSRYSDYVDLQSTSDGGRDVGAQRAPMSQSRPGYHVRTNELEFVMSSYPGVGCDDLDGICRA